MENALYFSLFEGTFSAFEVRGPHFHSALGPGLYRDPGFQGYLRHQWPSQPLGGFEGLGVVDRPPSPLPLALASGDRDAVLGSEPPRWPWSERVRIPSAPWAYSEDHPRWKLSPVSFARTPLDLTMHTILKSPDDHSRTRWVPFFALVYSA